MSQAMYTSASGMSSAQTSINVVSNNIASTTQGGKTTYYPLFGVKGKTLAGGASKNLSLQSYVPDKSFNTHYKGWGFIGAGAPRADFFGVAKVNIDTAI